MSGEMRLRALGYVCDRFLATVKLQTAEFHGLVQQVVS